MHLAVRHPDRVLGLVIADPLGAVSDGGAGSPAGARTGVGWRIDPAVQGRG
jgi:pimeloyl-ACP methyl ester carboxylesterase